MAVVDVALKLPKVGVDVAVTRPVELVERRELRASAGKLNAPEIVDEAVEKKPLRKPRVVEVAL